MKPEEKVEIMLWDWLKTKSVSIKEVYFNRTNKINAPVFTTTGINKKPDLLIDFDRGFGSEIIAVEVKCCTRSKDVHDSGKILGYYENYIDKSTKYFIDEKEIFINHFVVATENSIKGFLFKDEFGFKNNLDEKDNPDNEFKRTNARYKLIPEVEGIRTADFQRRLWSEWRSYKKRLKLEKQKLPSIGIIISDIKSKEQKPFLFTMIYVDWLDKKKSWRQRFLEL